MACSLICIGMLIWGVERLNNPKTFPIRHIKVIVQDHHIDGIVLQQTIQTHLQGGFFSLQAQPLKQALLALPWVAHISLRKIWPDQLVIHVEAQHPIARWGKDWLMTGEGELFRPTLNTIPTGLPMLVGPEGSAKELLYFYQEFTNYLASMHLTITSLELNNRHAWRIVLDQRMTLLLGRDQVVQRLQRFLGLYAKIIPGHEEQAAQVDLRYPNGLSILWKEKPK